MGQGTFLTWHRYFMHAWEQRLEACGFADGLPYWEWGLDVHNPAASPVFDGSDTSLGGNGAFFEHEGLILGIPLTDPPAFNTLPPGTGGGCVTSGPFGDMEVNLGPVALPEYGSETTTGVADPFDGTHTRCLKRDLNPGVAERYTSFRNTTQLILSYDNIADFQMMMEGDPRFVEGEYGVHGGGHYTIGGDPGSDPFISPGDPAFYLHHSQIDRVYWIWQMLDFFNRRVSFSVEDCAD